MIWVVAWKLQKPSHFEFSGPGQKGPGEAFLPFANKIILLPAAVGDLSFGHCLGHMEILLAWATSYSGVLFTQLVLKPQWVLLLLLGSPCKYSGWCTLTKELRRSLYFHLLLPISTAEAKVHWVGRVSRRHLYFPLSYRDREKTWSYSKANKDLTLSLIQ